MLTLNILPNSNVRLSIDSDFYIFMHQNNPEIRCEFFENPLII